MSNDNISKFMDWLSGHAHTPGNLTLVYDTFGSIPVDYSFAPRNEGQEETCTVFLHVKDMDGGMADTDYFSAFPPEEQADNPDWTVGWQAAFMRAMFHVSEMQSNWIGDRCAQIGFDVEQFMERTEGVLDVDAQLGIIRVVLLMDKAKRRLASQDTERGRVFVAQSILNICQSGIDSVLRMFGPDSEVSE